MYVCMYVCVYVSMYVNIYNVCIHIYLYIYLLYAARDHGATARNTEHVLDRHQEGLFHVTNRLRYVSVHGLNNNKRS